MIVMVKVNMLGCTGELTGARRSVHSTRAFLTQCTHLAASTYDYFQVHPGYTRVIKGAGCAYHGNFSLGFEFNAHRPTLQHAHNAISSTYFYGYTRVVTPVLSMVCFQQGVHTKWTPRGLNLLYTHCSKYTLQFSARAFTGTPGGTPVSSRVCLSPGCAHRRHSSGLKFGAHTLQQAHTPISNSVSRHIDTDSTPTLTLHFFPADFRSILPAHTPISRTVSWHFSGTLAHRATSHGEQPKYSRRRCRNTEVASLPGVKSFNGTAATKHHRLTTRYQLRQVAILDRLSR